LAAGVSSALANSPSGEGAENGDVHARTIFDMKRWSPYIVGACIGVLSWLAFLFADNSLGCSGAYAKSAGMVECAIRGKEKVAQKPYYRLFTPTVSWEWMLVVGIFFGALLSSRMSGDFNFEWVPKMWAGTFGNGVALRMVAAFAGGIFVGFGARWAGGCTSGHGISGTSQLAVSSWISAACFFIGGIATAMILYV
jgi:uncharacterized membrane protein YedE/YeeE